eukprot:gene35338-42821_t
MYYRGAAAAILVYDVTSAHSFEVLQTWVQELQDNTAVSTKAADEYAASVNAIFFETSAKLDIQVQGLFNTLCTLLITSHTKKEKAEDSGLKMYAKQSPVKKPCC